MTAEVFLIKSSFIGKEVTYLPANRRLCIIIGNHKYFYYDVSRIRLNKFLRSKSKGSYYCKFIKGKYQTLKRILK